MAMQFIMVFITFNNLAWSDLGNQRYFTYKR